jgi:hypothetical protein
MLYSVCEKTENNEDYSGFTSYAHLTYMNLTVCTSSPSKKKITQVICACCATYPKFGVSVNPDLALVLMCLSWYVHLAMLNVILECINTGIFCTAWLQSVSIFYVITNKIIVYFTYIHTLYYKYYTHTYFHDFRVTADMVWTGNRKHRV